MIGTLVNATAIIIGSFIGGLFKKAISDEITSVLMSAMGFAAFALGLNAIVQNMPKSEYPVLFIASLALGCIVGTKLDLDGRISRLSQRNENIKKNDSLGQGIVTGCLLFCIGTLSILGPVQSALYQDNTYLFTNASLDLVTSMVLATTYGIGMALASIVLVIWQGSIYFLTLMVGDFISSTMMVEISIVGGCLIAMSGMSIMNVKSFKTLNFLPALIFPIAWCLIIG